MDNITVHIWYGVIWLAFAASHSGLAALPVRRRLRPLFGAGYRLAYNILAATAIGLVLLGGWWLFDGGRPFAFPTTLEIALTALYIGGWILMIAAARQYDLATFAGTRQIRAARAGRPVQDEESLHFDGFHRYVRHPLYTAGFMILWGRIDSDVDLATAVWGSLYFMIGSRFEERRLIRLFGAPYAEYCRTVPAFLPWRGRLSRKELPDP